MIFNFTKFRKKSRTAGKNDSQKKPRVVPITDSPFFRKLELKPQIVPQTTS